MKNRLSRADVLAVLAAAGVVGSATSVFAAGNDGSVRHPALQVADQTSAVSLGSGKDTACGKGSCGTDEKGAKAAKDRDNAKTKKAGADKAAKPKTETPKTETPKTETPAKVK